jgi:hypothetical protein
MKRKSPPISEDFIRDAKINQITDNSEVYMNNEKCVSCNEVKDSNNFDIVNGFRYCGKCILTKSF